MTTLATPQQALSRLSASSTEKTDVELLYVSKPSWPVLDGGEKTMKRPLRIAVLDSSYNPPTKAHQAMAHAPLPVTISGDTPKDAWSGDTPKDALSYDAHILLLSVTNADKKLKPGDANYTQRLEMMLLLAEELQGSEEFGTRVENVAVAAIDEPTFVGKSRKLRKAIAQRIEGITSSSNEEDVPFHLYFLLGWDTVTRLFAPRFYSNSSTEMARALAGFFSPTTQDGDGSLVICSRRPDTSNIEEYMKEEEEFLSSEDVRGYYTDGRVVMIDLPGGVQGISSTKVRAASGKESKEEELAPLVPDRIVQYVSERGLYAVTS